MNSDVTIVWLDILPRLRRGVTIHIHDIFLPDDYPLDWSARFYSEQYLLAASLLAGAEFGLLFPSHFVQNDSRLYPELEFDSAIGVSPKRPEEVLPSGSPSEGTSRGTPDGREDRQRSPGGEPCFSERISATCSKLSAPVRSSAVATACRAALDRVFPF